jgi:hypothetical protein
MTIAIRFRDVIGRLLPKWLSDRVKANVGFRYVWSMIAPLDSGSDVLMEGMQAAWPGGNESALPYIGRSRGILRGQDETAEAYALRLRKWLATWRGDLPDGGGAGSQLATAMALHAYLAGNPRVRVVNRHGHWKTIEADGSLVEHDVAFDWDSVTNPDHATHWWDEWIIIYDPPWPRVEDPLDTGSAATFDGDSLGLGHDVTQTERDEIVGQIHQWKGGHTFIRAVIWSYDAALFDPDVPASLPDGTWGTWGMESGGVYGPSGRNVVDCRYWEPRP